MPKRKAIDPSNVEELIRYYEGFANEVGKYMLYDTVNGRTVLLDTLMYHIVKHLVKGRYRTIADPTCGTQNHLFGEIIPILRHWGIEYRPCDIRPDNWACKHGYPNCVCDVFKADTLPEGEVWVYDPPHIPHKPGALRRAEDYALKGYTLEEIRRFYSPEVFGNFVARGAKLVIVKGASFYYPKKSDNLLLFEKDIIQPLPNMKLVGRLAYRFYNDLNHLLNYRLRRSIPEDMIRLQTVSVVFLIFRVVH